MTSTFQILPSPQQWKHSRNNSWRIFLLCTVALMLFARTIAYNYDFAQSLKDNARNYNPFHKPVKSQPIKTKKPRAMSSITIPMAQSQSEFCQANPLVKTFSTLALAIISLPQQAQSLVREKSSFLLLAQSEPPNLCVRHANFRI